VEASLKNADKAQAPYEENLQPIKSNWGNTGKLQQKLNFARVAVSNKHIH
jgi:hypothetical protein